LTIEFEIEGQKFVALNGGPQFQFNESVSFVVNCETQKEVDYYWEKLSAGGGQESACGWLKDKFGVSWQVTPAVLIDMLHDKDAVRTIAAPTLVVGSDRDVMRPDGAVELFRLLPHAQLAILPRTEHTEITTRTSWLVPMINGFLDAEMPKSM